MSEKQNFEPRRLAAISRAMDRRKNVVASMLASYKKMKDWQTFKEGFLTRNIQLPLEEIVELKPCFNDDPRDSFFLLTPKPHILVCYNKIQGISQLKSLLNYNLVLVFDTITNPEANWNDQHFVTSTTIRALNIAKICNNWSCFKDEVNKRVEMQERFKGKKSVFTEVFEKSVNNLSPIGDIKKV